MRSGQLTVNARLKSSSSSSMSVLVTRPTTRSRKFSGSTRSEGSETPIDSATTEKLCVVVRRSLPDPLVVLYS